MSLLTILETLLIGPLKLVFEIIFTLANKFIGHPGLAIIVLSLIMNILVLPLYRRADAMQEEARDTEARLHDGVAHIKKTFSGDERMMILQTYYRQNNYKPTSALNGSVSLLLEIPFFMAAYQFLSNLEILNGVSLGPIADLGAPDGLLVIGGIVINILPVLMTLVNVISSALYLKGFPLKTKIQLYAMALFFLVFLYTSPSCLVFYWTLNNVFSLVKTIFYKLKKPRKVLAFLTSATGLCSLIFSLFFYNTDSTTRKAVLVVLGIVLQLPLIAPMVMSRVHIHAGEPKPNRKLFFLGSLFLTVLIGLLIPSAFIAASPQEYIDPSYFHNPLWFIASAACLAAGTFLVWLRVFYWLASPRGKEIFDKLVWILCGVMLVNYMFFGTNLGIISSTLQYETGLSFTPRAKLLNLLILAVVAVIMYLIISRWSRPATMALLTAVIALSGMSGLNMVTIRNSVEEIYAYQTMYSDSNPHFKLSKNGKNVIVLMLDRAMGEYIPYLFAEKPELEEQFAGFTYYANTVSFGGFTNLAAPALLGGYEYTPVEMNRRSSEPLVSKHNEALKVMPVLFSQQGYDVTVCDPVYANYSWIPDLSIFDDYPEIDTYITKGNFSDPSQKEMVIQNNYRNFFCFGIMKTMPLAFQSIIYGNGQYNQAASNTDKVVYSSQTVESISQSSGLSAAFMEPYNVLVNLPHMTLITETDINTFLFMTNDATHEPMLLKVPEYAPAVNVDNREYDATHTDRFTLDGRTLIMETDRQMMHYQCNMAAMIQLGNWFDYLRENGVYDNTRIILVADHGQHLEHLDELMMDDGETTSRDVEHFYPLLMVKDFNCDEFNTSYDFMTNADVPTLATRDLVDNPTNPFTGKPINSNEKNAHDQFLIMSFNWHVDENNGNTFLPSSWASVRDNLWDKNNWTFYNEEIVLTEHSAP